MKALGTILALLVTVPAAGLAQTTYHAFGDSITEGVGDDPASLRRGYPARLQALLDAAGEDAEVVNHGVPGEKTPEGLARLGSVLSQTASGDVFLLMEGTNDVTQRASISEETTIFTLDEIAGRAETRGLTVIHATVIPRPPFARRDPNNINTRSLNALIRNLAGIRLRGLADPFHGFGAEPNLFDRLYSDDPEDRVGHPNAAGYDLMAGIWFDVITEEDTVPPVHGVVSPPDGATNVPQNAAIDVDVWDFGEGIDLANTSLVVNGQVVATTPVGDTKRAELIYQPPQPLTGTVVISLRAQDLATPPNTIDEVISRFTIAGSAAALAGDLDDNGRVDGADLISFAFHFGAFRGEANYEPAADLDDDGSIDGEDLAVLAANFGKVR